MFYRSNCNWDFDNENAVVVHEFCSSRWRLRLFTLRIEWEPAGENDGRGAS
jgi:hypothetical protein